MSFEVQLHDAVDRGVEDEAEVLLRHLQRLVRLAHPVQGGVHVGQGLLLLIESLANRFARLGDRDLVRDDPDRDREGEDADEHARLQPVSPRLSPRTPVIRSAAQAAITATLVRIGRANREGRGRSFAGRMTRYVAASASGDSAIGSSIAGFVASYGHPGPLPSEREDRGPEPGEHGRTGEVGSRRVPRSRAPDRWR